MALDGRTLSVECPCPGTPHEEDTVTFVRTLPLPGGMEALAAIRRVVLEHGEDTSGIDLAIGVFPVYLRWAVESWTFVRDDGSPLDRDDAEYLPFSTKYQIADAADDLFGEEVTRPLAPRTRTSSRGGPTGRSTSASPASGPRRPSPSGRSSRNASAASEQ